MGKHKNLLLFILTHHILPMKNTKNPLLTSAIVATLLASGVGATAQTLFSDNFDSNTSANWTVNKSASDSSATFAFDYSTYGIPSAPRSTGGTTSGLRFLANQSAGVLQGISASPTGGSFTGDYRMSLDIWLNFNGPAPLGGTGSTQAGSFGIGTTGTTAQWAGAVSSVMFAVTTDGNSAQDFRVYTNNVHVAPATGVYAAGNTLTPDVRNAATAYYSQFGGVTPPAAQTTLYTNQTGASGAGVLAFGWHDVEIEKIGSTVTWTIDGLLIATVSTNAATPGNNIFLGYFDTASGSSTDANDFLINAIYDNVSVTAVPEPTTIALGLMGAAGLFVAARRKK